MYRVVGGGGRGQSAQLFHMMMTHFNAVVFVLLNTDISSFNPLYTNEFFHLACYNESLGWFIVHVVIVMILSPWGPFLMQDRKVIKQSLKTSFRIKLVYYFSVQNYGISRICSSNTCLFRPQWRHNPYKYFDFCGGWTHECGVRA